MQNKFKRKAKNVIRNSILISVSTCTCSSESYLVRCLWLIGFRFSLHDFDRFVTVNRALVLAVNSHVALHGNAVNRRIAVNRNTAMP
jgi:hypothetical protein